MTRAPIYASEDRHDLHPNGLRVTPAEGRFEEELRVGLHHQPRRDRQLVGELEDGLAATHRFSGHTLLLLEVVGEAQDGDRDPERVLRSRRQESKKQEPGVRVQADDVGRVVWTPGEAPEGAQYRIAVVVREDRLVDHQVQLVVLRAPKT